MSSGRLKSEDDLRARFVKDRARLVDRHRAGEGGGVIVRAYCRLVDATIQTLSNIHLGDPERIAVLATGGYGRGELAFESDIDLHLVYTGGEPPAGIRTFMQSLWDLQWELGHQVVTPDQAIELASADRETLTAYLETRTVWGSEELAGEVQSRVREEVLHPGLDDYLAAKVSELVYRHAQAGDTVYLSEPDVKLSPGGLRDLHTLIWLSNASGGPRDWRSYLAEQELRPEEYERLQNGYDLTWRIRNTLHILKGRCWDRLDHRSQSMVAGEMGYRASGGHLPVELFMREYYRASWEIHAFTSLRLAQAGWSTDTRSPTLLTVLGRERSGAQEWPEEEIRSDPLALLERFRLLARNRSNLSAETASFLFRNGRSLGARARGQAGHGAGLLSILAEPNAAWGIHAMHQLGVLQGLLPEFENLTALVQFDPYHHYTADEHTLRTLEALEAMLDGTEGVCEGTVAHQICEIVDELPLERWRPDREDAAIIRLAILYHDIGKGSGVGGHSERGARVLRNAGGRLGLDRGVLDDAVFLVRHHLLLSGAAQRRDIREIVLLKRIRRLVRDRRRLHMLALLTVSDMAALGPTSLTPWKVRLLVDLVENVERVMSGESIRLPEELISQVTGELAPEVRDRVGAFLQSMPPEYGRDIEPAALLADAELLERFLSATPQPGSPVAAVDHGEDSSQLTMVTTDRERLLSRVCGLLAANDVTILQARIFTRLDGLIYDRFTVADSATGGRMTPEQEGSVLSNLADVLDGTVDVEALLEEHRARWRLRDRPLMHYPVKVIHDTTASVRYTVIEVRAHDHVGLLHDVADTMAGLGVSIHQAFISTEGERAVDAFYVTDPLGAPLDDGARQLLMSALEETLRE